jgi:23S rRNA G2445 N2-methylase RlmL
VPDKRDRRSAKPEPAAATSAAASLRRLIVELSDPGEERSGAALRQLGQLGWAAAELALDRFPEAVPPLRGRLCAVVGRIAQTTAEPRALRFLLRALRDNDPKTRRNAAIALGKLKAPEIEAALLEALSREPLAFMQRSVVASLGKVGGERSRAALRGLLATDAETARVVAEALLKLERGVHRNEPSEIDASASPDEPIELSLHCRAGLEDLVADELASSFDAQVRGPALVTTELRQPLERVFTSRIWTRLGFALLRDSSSRAASVEAGVIAGLTSPAALRILRTFTRGTIRYRLEWEDAGHRRGLSYRVAREVARRCPELVNDPRASPWEARVSERGDQVRVELCPRGLEDPRFAYRVSDVPAASHPSVAAALARVAGARPADVVWDPFVGSGLELVERGLLGPYARLIGCDVAPRALAAAARNLTAARLDRFELVRADALRFDPPGAVDLIVTNPPLGRRVSAGGDLEGLYRRLLQRASRVLARDGRFVWISPLFEQSVAIAGELGLTARLLRRVDMGGFRAELQVFVRRSAA